MNTNSGLIDEMQQMQDLLYEKDGGKNVLFKNSQKTKIARTISQNFELDKLLNEAFFIVDGTNEIYMDYVKLKLFLHPDIYTDIVNYIINLYNTCISRYGSYNVNINLNTFTISAAERHRQLFILFANHCTTLLQMGHPDYSIHTNVMRLLNTPASIDMIARTFTPFLSTIVRERAALLTKSESVPVIASLGLRDIRIQV